MGHTVALTYISYLDAVLIVESRQGEAFLLVEWLAENDHLLKEEDSPLLHPAQKTPLRISDHERILQQEAALGHDLPLRSEEHRQEKRQQGAVER